MIVINELLIERIAMILYSSDGGVAPDAPDEEQKICLGAVREPWTEVAEWRRDDYRFQATYALNYLQENGMLK